MSHWQAAFKQDAALFEVLSQHKWGRIDADLVCVPPNPVLKLNPRH